MSSQYAGLYDDQPIPGRCWRHGERTFTSVFNAYQYRVEQCMHSSPAFQQCRQEADMLYKAMSAANILDAKRNYVGEQHRIVTRAQALRLALEDQDPSIRHSPWTSPLVDPSLSSLESGTAAPAAMYASSSKSKVTLERGEVTAYSALQSACLLLAALFERTPFSDTDIRKRVFADYSILKREFRHSQMRTLHGPTTSIGELFGSIKDLDRDGLADNITGIIFDDWEVHQRADAFLNSDLSVQATCLTQEGPVGKIACKLRTFVILALLQERLLRELFETKFVGDPVRGFEAMTMEDPLDQLDFVEAMVRNTPNAYAAGKGMYYAWLYAPEVNAAPEHWETIFGKGANCLPSLYGRINTPSEVVVSDPASDSGYSLDIPAALKCDFDQSDAQAAVGFPWADDLIGAFLRKLREAKQQQGDGLKRQKVDPEASGICKSEEFGAEESEDPADSESSLPDIGAKRPPRGGIKVAQKTNKVKREPADGTAAGPGPGSAAASRSRGRKQQEPISPSAPLPLEDKLHLPLGIFLVGIITSSAYTNTQLHIEDLLLMSININIFGAPKIWWWIPQQFVPSFKAYAETLTPGGRGDLYTKAIAPFLLDKSLSPAEHRLPLSKLKEFGARRVIQMPGMAILTSPGYAFHFTVSMGLNIAESCNMFLEMLGWDVERLWRERPLEQYPDADNSMAKWMYDSGVLSVLGLDAGQLHGKRLGSV